MDLSPVDGALWGFPFFTFAHDNSVTILLPPSLCVRRDIAGSEYNAVKVLIGIAEVPPTTMLVSFLGKKGKKKVIRSSIYDTAVLWTVPPQGEVHPYFPAPRMHHGRSQPLGLTVPFSTLLCLVKC